MKKIKKTQISKLFELFETLFNRKTKKFNIKTQNTKQNFALFYNPLILCARSGLKTIQIQKRLLNTSSENRESFNFFKKLANDLKLEFNNLDGARQDVYLKCLITSNVILYKELHKIFADPSADSSEKMQAKLETLKLKQKKYRKKFSIPTDLTLLIKKIDSYLSEKNLNKFDSFLGHNIIRSLSKALTKNKKTNLTEKKKMAISIFINGLKLFPVLNSSFGEALCLAFVLFVRRKSIQTKPFKYRQRIFLNFKDDSLFISRTSLILDLGQWFMKFLKKSKPEIEKEFPTKAEATKKMEVEIGIILFEFLEGVDLVLDEGATKKFVEKTGIKKTLGLVVISKKYLPSIFEVPFSPYALPFLTKPSSWEKNKNEQTKIFKLNTKKSRITYSLTNSEIKIMKYLQSNFYRINQNYLSLISLYPDAFIYIFLGFKNDIERDRFLRINKETGNFSVVSFYSYLETDLRYTAIKGHFKSFPDENVGKSLEEEKERVYSEYLALIELLFEFINIYMIAEFFKDRTFFFPVALSTKGKLYSSSARNRFEFQIHGLYNNLIELQGNLYNGTQRLPHISKNENKPINTNIPSDFWKKMVVQQGKSTYTTISIFGNIKRSCLPIDFSGTRLGIIYGLIGYEKGLKAAYIIKDVNCLQPSKVSLHNLFQQQFHRIQTKYPEFVFPEMFPEKFIREQAKLCGFSEQTISNSLSNFFYTIRDELFIEKHFKKMFKWEDLTQTKAQRIDYVNNFLLQSLIRQLESDIAPNGFKHIKLILSRRKFLKNISYAIIHWVDRFLDNCLPMLKEFFSTIVDSIDYEKPLLLTTGNLQIGQFKIEHLRQKKLKSYKPAFTKKSTCKNNNYQIYFTALTNKIDKKKASLSAVEDLINFLETRLRWLLISKCIKEKIVLETDDKYVYTAIENLSKIKKLYFESFKELILENSILTNFFEANTTKNTQELSVFLDKTNAANKKIVEKINANKLEMSKHILNFNSKL